MMRALRGAALVAAMALLPMIPALAAGLPATIRLAAPEQGGGGKSFAGAGPVSLAYARKAIEAEFEKDGVAVEWKFFKGAGPAINEALAAQQLDIVFLGDLAGVIGRANGLKTRLVAATGRGSNSYLATALGSGIHSFKDLKGKRVAVLRGTAYQLPFNRLLEAEGLTEKDVRFTNLDWPTSKAAVAAKDIDATFGGSDLQLLKLAGTADIPVSTKGKAAALGIQAGAIATQDFIDKYPEALTRVVKALVKQAQQASDESRAAALYEQFAQISGHPVALFSSEFEGSSLKARFSPLIDDGFVAGYRNVVAGARQLGIVRQSFDVDAWVEPRFVNAALRELKLEGYWAPVKAGPVLAAR